MRSISVLSHSFFYCSIQSNRYTASSFLRKSTTLLFTQHCALSPTHLLAMLSSHLRFLSSRVALPSLVNCSFLLHGPLFPFFVDCFFFRPFFAMLFSLFHGPLFSSWTFSLLCESSHFSYFSLHVTSLPCFWGRITPLVSLSSETAGGLFISMNFYPFIVDDLSFP
ncbi:hypothetical protein M438DRAFT_204485 [Aureobasidium pullulans EXF-150]|uniref:Uncharacterized protein n=1 Tax=Aureobasidium pullulans EXF-150 TaxID=1043002 RepID=A0A074XHI6_AURPU|nr:uncharacterized protein M438DRAFT_204485 [Aureobasidium pullulans EXF-150]KEQ84963.1 hypothetical protein M438DRAFT_204485 [Aureobasidium pullulans EXF-150]